ncbi:MAG: hypothetical protein K2X32_04555 [Phycisphaerales bacterium]|nr:hypothetical protein [Phycisphaerales bacterium]
MRTNTTTTLAAFLASIPEAERPRVEALADAILAEVGEQLADDATEAVEQAAEEIDFDAPAEEAIEREMRNIDVEEKVNDAIEEAGIDDLAERCEEALDGATAAKNQAERIASAVEDDAELFRSVTRGGLLRRLRWLAFGR